MSFAPHGRRKNAAEISRIWAVNPDGARRRYVIRRNHELVAVLRRQIGENNAASITIDFALEAKCYSTSNSVGVREMSRLISRLRHRQFGILVTTSYLDRQAYHEIKEDGHPIIVVSAGDIVGILKKSGIGTVNDLKAWLGSLPKT